MNFDYVVVGAGFAGSVCARMLAEANNKICVIDRRQHIGGNAFDRRDEHGILIHPYGPHIFHTNSKRIFEFLSRFTSWRFYEHRVLANIRGQLLPIPINKTTINLLYGLDLDEDGMRAFFERVRIPRDPIVNSEDVVLNSVGAELCNLFFRGYTKKQWGLDISQLSAGVAARIPTRVNDDDRYFTDTYQFLPADGYTELFKRMLNHHNILLQTGTDFESFRSQVKYERLIYTGPIDEFYGFRFGRLPYRSLKFEHEHLPIPQFQPVAQVNFPNDHEFTRITEFSHFYEKRSDGTSIMREFPSQEGEPFYPIPRLENEALFQKYKSLADTELKTFFVGRLAEYRYYNMDQVVGAALKLVERLS